MFARQMPEDEARAPLWNIANLLTISRFGMVPLLGWVLFVSYDEGLGSAGWRWVAAGVFVVAFATDYVDGRLARSRGLVTPFGKLADPIADKALTGTAWIALSLWGVVPWWVTGLILGRELGVTLLRFAVRHRKAIAAQLGGKLKTALQGVTIFWYIAPFSSPFSDVRPVLLGVTLAVTLATGVAYVRTLVLKGR